jgi:hypothetical protein
MKTLKIFAVLSLALIFIGVTAVCSKTNPNTDNGSGMIKYQVNVHSTSPLVLPPEPVYVVITDENGNPVARPQVFTPGTWIYTFGEAGPVKGVREARMVLPGGRIFPGYPYPDIQKGPFLSGHTYLFNLYPVDQPPDNGNEN